MAILDIAQSEKRKESEASCIHIKIFYCCKAMHGVKISQCNIVFGPTHTLMFNARNKSVMHNIRVSVQFP